MKIKVTDFFKRNYKDLIFIFIFIITNIFSIVKLTISTDNLFVHKYSKLIIPIFIFIEIILYIISNFMIKKEKTIEKVFLSIVIPIGLLYMVLIPIGRIPDEANHAKRAYEISEGHLVSSKNKDNVGGQVLDKRLDEITDEAKYGYYDELYKTNKKVGKKFLVFPNTSLYSFINYIPQSIGILIGKLFRLPLIFQLYLGRIVNFIVWALLMFFSLKLIPYKKVCVFAFLFLPMMLQEAVSLSADALTNGISFFLIAYALYLKERKADISTKNIIIMSLTTIILSMCKIVYLPICLILFIIPYKKFSTKKKKYLKIGILAIIVVLLSLIWLKISSSYLVEYYSPGVDSPKQLSFILHNPLHYIFYCFNTLYEYLYLWIFQFLGSSLCWFDVNLSSFYLYIILFLFIYVLIFDNTKKIEIKDKVLSGIIVFGTLILILTSLYIQWTPVGKNVVDGIQGRYFIPLLIPISILFNFPSISINRSKNFNLKLVTYVMIFCNIYALMTLFYAHI